MASPAILDFDALLRPISEESPAGANLREDFTPSSIYYKVKDFRTAARAAERRGQATYDEEVRESPPDWDPILREVPDILARKSKDLELTAWLIEALVRDSGFAGLRDGFRLARELVERYWENVHPAQDEDGLVTKVAPITGLNGEGAEGTLIGPIAMVEITAGSTYGAFSSWHYDQSRQLQLIDDPEKREQRVAAGATTPEMFQASVAETEPAFFRNLVEDLDLCIAEYANLCTALDERCGPDAPPSSSIRQALEAVREKMGFITKDILMAQPEEDPEIAGGASNGGPATPSHTGGPIKSREDAFKSLEQVAQFFRRTEPHSPISYTLEQTVRWGRLTLPELINELIQDPSARSTYRQLIGIPESQNPE